MEKIIITITAILLFGNLNAQMVDETDQGLRIDCAMLQENIEFQLQQYEVNVDRMSELLEEWEDAYVYEDYQQASANADFHSLKAEQFSVIYSAICK